MSQINKRSKGLLGYVGSQPTHKYGRVVGVTAIQNRIVSSDRLITVIDNKNTGVERQIPGWLALSFERR